MSHVYFIQTASGPIKIGISKNPGRRLSALQTAAHEPLTLLHSTIGDEALEKRLHADLAEHRLDGEWFRDCPAVREAMERLPANDDWRAPTAGDYACERTGVEDAIALAKEIVLLRYQRDGAKLGGPRSWGKAIEAASEHHGIPLGKLTDLLRRPPKQVTVGFFALLENTRLEEMKLSRDHYRSALERLHAEEGARP